VTGTIAASLALLLGAVLAWFVTRTDLPGRGWFRAIFTLPYIVPSFAIALAWETLFRSPTIGGAPGFLQGIFAVSPPEWLSYGPVPIIITMTIHYSPFSFLLISGALATVDSQMEESAELLGASRFSILRRITFPIVRPAFMAALVLTFGRTIGTFALPFFLGTPVRYHTLATTLYQTLRAGFEPIAYVLAIMLVLITSLVVYGTNRYLGKDLKRFQTVGGKGFKGEPTRLRQWRWPALACMSVLALVMAVFPLALLGYQTLMRVPGRFDLTNLTLHFWTGTSDPNIAQGEPGVLRNPMIVGAAWNSVRLAVLGAVFGAALGLIVAYLVVRNRKSLVATILDQISFLPFLFPAIAFGAMYLSLFAVRRGPIPALYGTFLLLVVITVVKRLPYSIRTGVSAVAQIGVELEEAAVIQGATWLQRIRKIVAPLGVSGMISGMMVIFVGMMRELPLVILLITPKTRVLMTLGFQYTESGLIQLGNSLVFVVVLITIAGELLAWALGRSPLSRLRERRAPEQRG
jgi:iron(III) transport system permease protein